MSSPLSNISASRAMAPPAPVQPQAAVRAAAPADAAARPDAAVDVSAFAAEAEQSRRELQETLQRLNDHMKRSGRDLAFTVDEAVDRTVITVKNTETGKVVRQIPDESMLRVAHSIEDLKGLLHNELT